VLRLLVVVALVATSALGACGRSNLDHSPVGVGGLDATTGDAAEVTECPACPAGSTCDASQCMDAATTVRYGHSSEYSPCGIIAGNLAANILYAQPLIIPAAMKLTAFGVFGNQPVAAVNGIMALYADGNGAPSAPVAFSDNTAIVAGNNALAVTPPMAVSAGSYWIAGEFDADASICSDNAATNQIDFVSVFPYGLTPNPFRDTDGGAPHQLTQTIDLNFYVIGTQ
jgi:hypothetical protein